MEIAELASRIEKFPERLPISDKFEKASGALSSKKHHHVWYSSQKEHWLGWLSHYPWGKSAEFVYNHLKCAPMLVWLAEATGVSKAELTKASDAALAALAARVNLSSECAAVRKLIPWRSIKACLDAH
jgi:hypothetical protein